MSVSGNTACDLDVGLTKKNTLPGGSCFYFQAYLFEHAQANATTWLRCSEHEGGTDLVLFLLRLSIDHKGVSIYRKYWIVTFCIMPSRRCSQCVTLVTGCCASPRLLFAPRPASPGVSSRPRSLNLAYFHLLNAQLDCSSRCFFFVCLFFC